jgi:hypothetical protein
MGWKEFFGLKKKLLHESEIAIIQGAFDDVSKGGFDRLYLKNSEFTNFKSYGYKTKEEAIAKRIDVTVKDFLKSSHYLSYVITHSGRLYKTFKELDAENKLLLDNKTVMDARIKNDILNALGGLDTLRGRLEQTPPEYCIREANGFHYPGAICEKTPEETRVRFVELIQPLLKLK